MLYGAKKVMPLARLSIVEGVLNLAVSIALARPMGVVGVAIGTTVPGLLVRFVLLPRYGVRVFGGSFARFALRTWTVPLVACAATTLAVGAFVPRGADLSWPALFALAAGTQALFLAVAFALAAREPPRVARARDGRGGRARRMTPFVIPTEAEPEPAPAADGATPADAAAVPAAAPPPAGGWFDLASTSLRGLPAPFWILQGYLFLGVTFLDEEWPAIGKFRPRLVLGGLALLISVSRWFSAPRKRVAEKTEHRYVAGWLVAFIVAGLCCATWAFEPSIAWDAQIAHTTTMLVFFLMLAIVRSRREVLVTILVFTAGSAFYLLRSATEYLNGKHQFTMGVSRMMGAGNSLADPNSFGGTIAFSLPILLFAAIHARSRLLKFCVLCYGLLAAYCSISTHSRSGFILLALNVVWALFSIPSAKARIAIAAVLLGFGVYLVGFQSKNALERYASIFSSNTYEHESSTRGRIEGYQIAAKMVKDEPLFGVGPGCWSVYRMRRVDGDKLMPHNMPGQLAATMGIAGVFTFLGYLIAVLSFGLSVRRRRAGSSDRWDAAVRALAATTLVTFALLLVSGTAAHNIERSAWYLMPALLACAARAKDEPAPPVAGRAP